MSSKELTLSEKLTLVKKARRSNDERFRHICRSHSISSEILSLWVDSFEAGGEMGLRALDEVIDPPVEEVERAINVVKLYLDYKFPRQTFNILKRKNKINVSRINKGINDNNKPVFQIRYFETKSKKALWLLYWQRPDGRWWPYITSKQRIYKIDQLMEEVLDDPHQCIWCS